MPTSSAATSTAATTTPQAVWYYRNDKQTWWPALQFDTAREAYGLCVAVHGLRQEASSYRLLRTWALVCLQQAQQQARAKQPPPVLAVFDTATQDLQLLVLPSHDDDDDNDNTERIKGVSDFLPNDLTPALLEALQQVMQLADAASSSSPSSPLTDAGRASSVTTTTQDSSVPTTRVAPTNTTTHTTTMTSRTTTATIATDNNNNNNNNNININININDNINNIDDNINNTTEYIPPVEGEPILPHEDWTRVWKKLQFSGWTPRPSARGLRYVKPGGRGDAPSDSFASLAALQSFCARAYQWEPPVPDERPVDSSSSSDNEEESEDEQVSLPSPASPPSRAARGRDAAASPVSALTYNTSYTANTTTTTPNDRPTRPQDPGRPLLASAEPPPPSSAGGASVSSAGSDQDSQATKNLNDFWEEKKEEGWTCAKGRGIHTWHYIRPGCTDNKDADVLGMDYYVSLYDAYLAEEGRTQEQAAGRRGRASRATRAAKTSGAKRRAAKRTTASRPVAAKKKQRLVSPTSTVASRASKLTRKLEQEAKSSRLVTTTTTQKKPAASTKAANATKASSAQSVSSKKSKSQAAPIKTPKWPQIRALLAAKCDFELLDRRALTYPSQKLKLTSDIAMGMALLKFGVPKWRGLTDLKQEQITVWLRQLFDGATASKDFKLASYLRSDKQQLKSDLTELGFSFQLGMLYLPHAPASSSKRTHKEHYYKEEEVSTVFVDYLRSHFDQYVPRHDSLRKYQAFARVGAWMATVPRIALPDFEEFPVKRDDFWKCVERASRILKDDEVDEIEVDDMSFSSNTSGESKSIGSKSTTRKSSKSLKKSPSKVRFMSTNAIEPILLKLGYAKDSLGEIYCHPQIPNQQWDSLENLRDFAANNGIPSYSSNKGQLSSDERRGLFLWLFARHVSEEEYHLSESQPKLEDVTVRSRLCQGGWNTCDGQMIHYTASAVRVKGKDSFPSLEQVARKIALDKEIVKEGTLSSQEILDLRLWSLRHPKELNKDYRTPTKRRRGMVLPSTEDSKKPRVAETESPMVAVAETEASTIHDVTVLEHSIDETEPTMPQPLEASTIHDVEVVDLSATKTTPVVATAEASAIHPVQVGDHAAAEAEPPMVTAMEASVIQDLQVGNHSAAAKQDVEQQAVSNSPVVESKSDVPRDPQVDEAKTGDETMVDVEVTEASANEVSLSADSTLSIPSEVTDGAVQGPETVMNDNENANVDDNEDTTEMDSPTLPMLTQLTVEDDEVLVEEDQLEGDEDIPGLSEATSAENPVDESATKAPAAPLLTQVPYELENDELSILAEEQAKVEKEGESSETLLEDSLESPTEAEEYESAKNPNTLPVLTQPGAEMDSDDESTQEEGNSHLENKMQVEETPPGENDEDPSEATSQEAPKAVSFEESGHKRLGIVGYRGLYIYSDEENEEEDEENEGEDEDNTDSYVPLTQVRQYEDPIDDTGAQVETNEGPRPGLDYESDDSMEELLC